MSGKNEHFENFVLFLVVGGLVAGAALYVLFLFWPYLAFYIFPFVAGSLVVGGILRAATGLGEGGQGIVNHRGLAVAYPILLLVVAVVFFADSKRAVVVDKKGNVTGMYYLDWPEVNKAFNEERSSTYASAPFDSLKAKAREGVVYDRQEMGWIFLWCLFLGGPAFFWYLSRRDREKTSQAIESIVDEQLTQKRLNLEQKSNRLNAIIESNAAALKADIVDLKKANAALLDENLVLKATVEFSSEVVRPTETPKTGGVLDSDIL